MATESQSGALDRQDEQIGSRLARLVTWLVIVGAAIGFWTYVGLALLGVLRSQ